MHVFVITPEACLEVCYTGAAHLALITIDSTYLAMQVMAGNILRQLNPIPARPYCGEHSC
jgi:hypothetical protein